PSAESCRPAPGCSSIEYRHARSNRGFPAAGRYSRCNTRGGRRPVPSKDHSRDEERYRLCPRSPFPSFLSFLLSRAYSFSLHRVLRAFFLENQIVLNGSLKRVDFKRRRLSLISELEIAFSLVFHEYLERAAGIDLGVVFARTAGDLNFCSGGYRL